MIAQIFLKPYNFWLKIIACEPVLVSEKVKRGMCRHHALPPWRHAQARKRYKNNLFTKLQISRMTVIL